MKVLQLLQLALLGVALLVGGCLEVRNECDDPENDAHKTLSDTVDDEAEGLAGVTPMCMDVELELPMPGPGQL